MNNPESNYSNAKRLWLDLNLLTCATFWVEKEILF